MPTRRKKICLSLLMTSERGKEQKNPTPHENRDSLLFAGSTKICKLCKICKILFGTDGAFLKPAAHDHWSGDALQIVINLLEMSGRCFYVKPKTWQHYPWTWTVGEIICQRTAGVEAGALPRVAATQWWTWTVVSWGRHWRLVNCRRKTPSQKLTPAKELVRENWYHSNWLFAA